MRLAPLLLASTLALPGLTSAAPSPSPAARLADALVTAGAAQQSASPGYQQALDELLASHAIDTAAFRNDLPADPTTADLLAHAAIWLHTGSPAIRRAWEEWQAEPVEGLGPRPEPAADEPPSRGGEKPDAAQTANKKPDLNPTATLDWLAAHIKPGAPSPQQALAQAIPQNWIYQGLLAEYEKLEKQRRSGSGPAPLPTPDGDQLVKVGEPYAAASELARRLEAAGHLPPGAPDPDGTYTPELEAAVKSLQDDEGLQQDGIIGPNTLANLNRTNADKLAIVRLNLDRARLLPRQLGNRHLIVNLPSGQLLGFEGSENAIAMRVIFGGASHRTRTELFSGEIETVVFRPYWNVPHSIATDEIIPAARKNPSHITSNNYEFVSNSGKVASRYGSPGVYASVESGVMRIRQRPGPDNALGLVKFLFPNEHAIYLHDTPNDSLFQRSRRDFSHGCIRVQFPDQLATWVLGPQGWDPARVSAALAPSASDNEYVKMESPLPVYIVYFTALPQLDRPGAVRYYHDVYGHDSSQLANTPASDG